MLDLVSSALEKAQGIKGNVGTGVVPRAEEGLLLLQSPWFSFYHPGGGSQQCGSASRAPDMQVGHISRP